MKKNAFTLFFLLFFVSFAFAAPQEVRLWPGLAPGETVEDEDRADPRNPTHFTHVTVPTLTVYRPENRTSSACLIIFPGGGYGALMGDYEGSEIAEYWNAHGVTAVVVKYRVPRRPNLEKHQAAWQDGQRAIRWVRAHATELEIDPERIGATGFSAGGHLTVYLAVNSQTKAYEPVDELDAVSCHLNFAIPVYPAYVLEDGKDGANTGRGNDSKLTSDLKFEAKTPPMCLIHGDADVYSPMGSIEIYHQLRRMNIPAEAHIYALKVHGLLNVTPGQDHADTWKDRSWDWFVKMGF